MVTVPEAARIVGRNPETVRRWIREGKLRAHKIGTQHVIEEGDLESAVDLRECAPMPEGWRVTRSGRPAPNPVAAIRRTREGR